MIDIDSYITEKFKISKDSVYTEDSRIINKLARVLKKFFGDDITMCKDYQGDKDKESSWFYELNPESMIIGGIGNPNKAKRFIQYCKKIDDIEVKDLPGGVRIGTPTIWVKVLVGYNFKGIRVSKTFYDSEIFPYDQSNVTSRGWRRWQGHPY